MDMYATFNIAQLGETAENDRISHFFFYLLTKHLFKFVFGIAYI